MRQWEGSGLSQENYCRRRGLALSTFQYWRRRLDGEEWGGERAAEAAVPESAFIPVQVSGRPLAQGGWACEILGPEGLRVRLREQPEVEKLREIVGVLKGAGQ